MAFWGHTDRVMACALVGSTEGCSSTAHGGLVVTAGYDRTVRLWKLINGECLGTLAAPEAGRIRAVACSPDGHTIAAGADASLTGGAASILFWDLRQLPVAKQGPRLRDTRHGSAVYVCCFSPSDAELLATGGRGNQVCLWQWRSGRLLRSFFTAVSQVLAVSFSFDGGFIASSGEGSAVELWGTAQQSDWECHGAFRGHEKAVFGCAIAKARRGRYLLVSISGRSARVWKFRPDEPVEKERARVAVASIAAPPEPEPEHERLEGKPRATASGKQRASFGQEEEEESEAFGAYRERIALEKAARADS